jgi:hypothetical protein
MTSGDQGIMSEANNPSLSAKYQSKCLDESRGIFHLQMSQACLSEIEQMKNVGGEATEAFTWYLAGLPLRDHDSNPALSAKQKI